MISFLWILSDAFGGANKTSKNSLLVMVMWRAGENCKWIRPAQFNNFHHSKNEQNLWWVWNQMGRCYLWPHTKNDSFFSEKQRQGTWGMPASSIKPKGRIFHTLVVIPPQTSISCSGTFNTNLITLPGFVKIPNKRYSENEIYDWIDPTRHVF